MRFARMTIFLVATAAIVGAVVPAGVAHAQSANDFAYLATTPASAAKKALDPQGLLNPGVLIDP